MEPALEMKNISKMFPGVKALDNVCINLYPGEVHAIVGENGAGKSTLMKILSGAYQPDNGEMLLEKKNIKLNDTRVSNKFGIKMIYQELNLLSNLPVYSNMFLGYELIKGNFLDIKEMKKQTKERLLELGVDIDPNLPLHKLGIGQQQMLEIAKAISGKAKVIVFDEPTASLTNKEINQLFKTISVLKQKKVAIFYISHRIEEIFKIADRVSIMRDGKLLKTEAISNVTVNSIIEQITGREINNLYPHIKKNIGKCILEVNNLSSNKFKNVSIKVYEGEIVCLSGLVGAGRTEIVRAIFGIDNYDEGEVLFNGKRVTPNNPKKSVEAGISLLPENRKDEGLALILDVIDNTIFAALKILFPNNIITTNKEKKIVQKLVNSLDLSTPSLNQQVQYLSGGTQQKVVLAKWLLTKAKLFIFDEPTRGIDVGTRTEIYKLIDELINNGAGVLMVSSDIHEVMGMSDRIYVITHGRIVGNLITKDTNQKEILNLSFGQQKRGEINEN